MFVPETPAPAAAAKVTFLQLRAIEKPRVAPMRQSAELQPTPAATIIIPETATPAEVKETVPIEIEVKTLVAKPPVSAKLPKPTIIKPETAAVVTEEEVTGYHIQIEKEIKQEALISPQPAKIKVEKSSLQTRKRRATREEVYIQLLPYYTRSKKFRK
jgi:hypothetical protein